MRFWVAEQSARVFCPLEKKFRECFSTAAICPMWSVKHIFKHLKPNVEVPAFYFWDTCDSWFAILSGITVSLSLEAPQEMAYSTCHAQSMGKLLRSGPSQVSNISKDGNSVTPLGSLFQCLNNEFFCLMVEWNFFCYSLCPLPLALPLNMSESGSIIFISAFSYTLIRLLFSEQF